MKFRILNFKYQKNLPNKMKWSRGFSLAEIIVVVAIAAAIFMAVFNFGTSIFSFNSTAQKNLSAQTDARRVLKSMVAELRKTSPSSLGAYPISVAATSTITFFSNLDSDAYKEQIRYFLQNRELKRGVIKPSGTPLTYNPADEQIITLIRGVNNGTTAIFDYFDENYAGTSTPLTQPVQITNVRMIRITVQIVEDPNKSFGPLIVESQVSLRNLKDNL